MTLPNALSLARVLQSHSQARVLSPARLTKDPSQDIYIYIYIYSEDLCPRNPHSQCFSRAFFLRKLAKGCPVQLYMYNMYTFLSIYKCICIQTYTCVYIYRHMLYIGIQYISLSLCIYIYIFFRYVYIYIYIYIYMYTCLCPYIITHTYIHTYIHANKHIYMPACLPTYIHTYIHT